MFRAAVKRPSAVYPGEVRPDANDPRAPYLQVAEDLRAAITDGEYRPGQRLPSGRELARRYGVAAMTIHHAIGVLREEQMVVSYQGRGVYVANHATGAGNGQAPGREDPALGKLRQELASLADRVARLERLLPKDKASRRSR